MKRWLIVLMVAVCSLSLASAALAAGPKVPKTLCFSFNIGAQLSLLYIKSTGVIKTATGATKIYSVSGMQLNNANALSFPVTGSAYVVTNGGGSTLHLTYTGMQSIYVAPYAEFHAEAIVDLADLSTGMVSWGYLNLANAAIVDHGIVYSWTLVDPLTITIPHSIESAGAAKP
jgi:hypothetical protein